jgi:D-inositol-3-phosphate glycosyltransferase
MLNRVTLKIQYQLADHIFVHTEKMKRELVADFGVRKAMVTVIPYGINASVPNTDLEPAAAKRRLGIGSDQKTILFFGSIAPYKGLDVLVEAFQKLTATHKDYNLIIAGRPKKGSEEYFQKIQHVLNNSACRGKVIQRIEYIPDEEAEVYFKAADLLVLPYIQIFQSGILFFAFNFGLPVVASDVGCFREDVIPGKTGNLCRPSDSGDLAAAIEKYFESDLFEHLDSERHKIRSYISARHSWDIVAKLTRDVHARLAGLEP